jgi:hypothetical protein
VLGLLSNLQAYAYIHIEWMALMKRKYRDGAPPYRKITTEICEDDAKVNRTAV